MTPEEHQMMREVHEWLFKPPISGKPPRAHQLDDALAGIRAGKMFTRVLLYAAGFIVAVGGSYGTIKGWFK